VANREKGESTLEVDGKTYTLVMGLDEICQLEEIVSRGGRDYTIKEVIDLCQRGSLRFVRAILWAALIRHQPRMTLEDVSGIIEHIGGMQKAYVVMGEVFKSMAPDPEDVKKDSKPSRPRKAQIDGTGAASTSKPVASA
jgi:hypothetical protein